MDSVNEWLRGTESRAAAVAEAYTRQLGRLWWANLLFVVVPALLSTGAAIVAALPETKTIALDSFSLPLASVFAGTAAILMAVHKALKCDEYQAECLRLSHVYQSIAISAGSALSKPEAERALRQERIARKLERITEDAKALLPTSIVRRAERISPVNGYARSAVASSRSLEGADEQDALPEWHSPNVSARASGPKGTNTPALGGARL